MTDSPPTAMTIVAWVLLGGYFVVWGVRNFRSILAVVGGAMVANVLAAVSGGVVGFFFAMYHAHAGIPEAEGLTKMLHNPGFWLICTLISFFFAYWVGFITGLAAGSYEVFYAGLAALVGGLMSPDLPSEMTTGSAGYFWWFVDFITLALTMWGGYGAKRAKAIADETLTRGGADVPLGPRRL